MIKDYLEYEDGRNRDGKQLFSDILTEAFRTDIVLIAHHLCYRAPDGSTIEIPSADTLVFDHAIMTSLFGSREAALRIMRECATVPAAERDALLAHHYYARQKPVAAKVVA